MEPCKSSDVLKMLENKDRINSRYADAEDPLLAGGYGKIGKKRAVGGRIRSSGNLERKYGDDYGRPGSHKGASVPWAGTLYRNRRTVWEIAASPSKALILRPSRRSS